VVVYGPKELIVEYAIKLEFAVSNNAAEYKVIIVDLNVVEAAETDIGGRPTNGSFKAKEPTIVKYLEKVRGQMKKFEKISVTDSLSKLASMPEPNVT